MTSTKNHNFLMASHLRYRRSSFILLPILLLLAAPTLSDPQTEDLINKICYQMEEYGFCSKTFHENMKSPSADIRTLTQISLEQSLINATNTHKFVMDLYSRTPQGPDRYALMACDDAYTIQIKQFGEAINYLNSGDYQSVVDSLRILPRALGSCTSYYLTPPYPPNPLVDRNRRMRMLITMSTVTAYYLVQSI